MTYTIGCGPAKVIATGSVTAFFGHPLRFDVAYLDRNHVLLLEFARAPEIQDVAVHTEWLPDGMKLTLVNFDQADGRGSANPVLLSEFEEELLFFHFRVFRLGQSDDRTVHYSFYAVQKQDVDWTPG
ncbi:MAG: hypothetical protein JRI25_22375 [Deltaproteobacteria bacterium]|nr:hypothetical protein [Deltaproteobacteria bacterium]